MPIELSLKIFQVTKRTEVRDGGEYVRDDAGRIVYDVVRGDLIEQRHCNLTELGSTRVIIRDFKPDLALDLFGEDDPQRGIVLSSSGAPIGSLLTGQRELLITLETQADPKRTTRLSGELSVDITINRQG